MNPETKFNWQPPETAPKDGTVIIADFGYPSGRFTLSAWKEKFQEWSRAATIFWEEKTPDGTLVWRYECVEGVLELKRWMPMDAELIKQQEQT